MNPLRKAVLGGAVLASTLGGGLLGAAYLGGTATAATGSTSTTAAAPMQAPQGPQGQRPAGAPDPTKGGHQANGITEAVLTGDTADKVKSAALAAVPGATVLRVENDAEGATYEAHLTKADGSLVTVKLDAAFKVTSTIDGMG